MIFVKLHKFLVVFAISVLLVLVSPANSIKQLQCFLGKFLSASCTDAPPDYTVNMTVDDEGTLHTTTNIGRIIASPITYFKMSITNDATNRQTVLYNLTVPLCQLSAVFNKTPVIRQGFRLIAKNGNYTYKCPAMPGVYVSETKIDNNPLTGFLYRPKVSYTIEGSIYELSKNKVLTNLTTFKTKIRITKVVC